MSESYVTSPGCVVTCRDRQWVVLPSENIDITPLRPLSGNEGQIYGGIPKSVIRDIEMRDMVVMSILLAGFAPYLTDQINADVVYRGDL